MRPPEGTSRRLHAVTVLLLVLSGCMGNFNNGPASQAQGSSAAAATIKTLGQSRLLRLTSAQYDNCVRDLLGDITAPASKALSDEMVGPFPSNSVAPISDSVLSSYQSLADGVTSRALPAILKMLPCDPNAPGDETACVQGFIADFAPKVYRRALAADESTELVTLFTSLRVSLPFAESVRTVTGSLLQSPWFLYRVESGEPGASGAVVPLTGDERATRLSFFLWGSTPDDTLRAAAASGGLATADQVEAQARRMLASPKAASTVQAFFHYWLAITDLSSQVKNPNVFPNYTPTTYQSMLAETDAFVAAWFAQPDNSVGTLLTAPYTYADATLAGIYGVTLPDPSAGMQRVTLPSQRAGILMQGAFLAKHAHADQTSIVRRGLFMRSTLLCQVVGAPPPTVNTTIPPADPNQTSRQREDIHRNNPNCAGCHNLLDPMGDGFEQFDAIGQFQTHDGIALVDATGAISGTDVDGAYGTAVEEVTKLAKSQDVQACIVKQWYRFALNRLETPDDAATLDALVTAAAAKNNSVSELLISISRSDAMLYMAK